MSLLKTLHVLALVVWVGEIVFFSFVAAPAIFGTLKAAESGLDPDKGAEVAGRVVGAIFPVYYRLGYACGAILLITSLAMLSGALARNGWLLNSGLVAVMLALTLYAGLVVQPRASALRPQIHDPTAAVTAKPEFDRLHRLAVILNGAVLLCGVGVTILTARSLKP